MDSEINLEELECIYRSIPTDIPDDEEPIPIHRQVAGNSIWTKIVNTMSLARQIIHTEKNKESQRYIWAKTILDRLGQQ